MSKSLTIFEKLDWDGQASEFEVQMNRTMDNVLNVFIQRNLIMLLILAEQLNILHYQPR